MSTSAIAGFTAFLFVDVASTQTKVAEVREVTLSITHDVIDATTHDDAPWMTNIAGLRSFTLSGEALYLSGDPAQEVLIDKILDGTSFTFELRPEDTATKRKWTGTARMTSWEQSTPNDDADAISLEMQGVGALVDGVI